MELAIAERLVCPHPHRTTPLVVRADQVEHGRLLTGVAGCPVCLAEWRIDRGGIVLGPASAGACAVTPGGESLAALLALTEPGMIIVADGIPADDMRVLTAEFAARVIALDAPGATRAAAVVTGAERVPLAEGVAAGALLFRTDRSEAFVESAVQAVRANGRVVAAAGVRESAAIRVVARDACVLVGERAAREPPVRLQRRPG